MCGIHLIVDKKFQLSPLSERSGVAMSISARWENHPMGGMLQSTLYRGPDHSAALSVKGTVHQIFLGSNRLKIIGLEDAANQPFTAENGRYALAYNGAIYNFYELRNDLLKKGEAFNTHSDTEVVMKLLIREGYKALAQLKGMFALIWYDTLTNNLVLARDAHGMKPLFYYEDEHYLLASSEITGILSSGLVEKKLNEKQIYHYLRFKYAQAPETFYKHIKEFLPGQFLLRKEQQTPVTACFQQPECTIEQKQRPLPDSEVLRKTEELLTQSVLEHLIADVPYGIFLSGGVDSTLLLALLHKAGMPPLPSFTIFGKEAGKSFNTLDSKYAKLAAKQYGSIHYEVTVKANILDKIEELVDQLDQPVGDSAALFTWLLSEEAGKTVKVVLSGAGADELFGGYNRHAAYYQYLKNYRLIRSGNFLLSHIIEQLPSGINHPLRNQFRLLKKLSGDISPDPVETFINFITFREFDHLAPRRKADKKMLDQKNIEIEKYMSFALRHDQSHYLVSDVLALNDRMSMARSLEMRMPYLGQQLVDYTTQLPATYRLAGGRKWILKKLLKNMGGAQYVNREKEGFGLPYGAWLQGMAYEKVKPFYEDEKALIYRYVDFASIKQMLAKHRSKNADYGPQLWSFLVLSAWIEKKFQK